MRVLKLWELYRNITNTVFQYNAAITAAADPTVDSHAVTKQYVDNLTLNLSASNITSGTINVSILPSFSGDVTSSAGSPVLSLTASGVNAGTYPKVTVDVKGRITSATSLLASDIPNLDWSKITTGKPTTLAGYGITDGVPLSGATLTGNVTTNAPTANLHAATKGYIDSVISGINAPALTGDIIRFPKIGTYNGYLRCNGAEVSKTTYANLYAVIGDTYNYDLQPGSGKPWKQQYAINTEQSGDITGWTTSTPLPGPLHASQAIVTKNRVYLLGSWNGSSALSTVYTAPINTDGTLGTWTTGPSLPGALGSSQAIVTKNRVYLLGGWNSSGAVSTVYTASINADGTLGTWTTGTSLPGPLCHSQAIVTKNRVYLLGGLVSSDIVSTVYTASINADGTLGAWTTGPSLPGVLHDSQAIVTKNRVYLLGGDNAGGYTSISTIYTAPINADGTLGTWTTSTPLPGPVSQSQAIVTKNRVYLMGGHNGTNFISTVYTAPINADGTLGTWTTGPSLPGPLDYSQAIVTKNRVYLLGGRYGGDFSTVSTVYTAPIQGGLNDYSPYYDGTFIPTDPNNFRLPDYTLQESDSNGYFYIKT